MLSSTLLEWGMAAPLPRYAAGSLHRLDTSISVHPMQLQQEMQLCSRSCSDCGQYCTP